jgi:chemotaxis protein MotB
MSEQKAPIIVKRIKKGGGHHGGAWKIAYADFVTAMMAFFLLMWLLGSTTKGDLEGHRGILQDAAQGRDAGRLGQRRQLQRDQGRRRRHDPHHRPDQEKLERRSRRIRCSQFRRQILLDMTPEGLRIQIVDENSRPMFDRQRTAAAVHP